MPSPTPPLLPPLSRAWIGSESVRVLLEAWRTAGAVEPCGLLLGKDEAGVLRIQEVVQVRNSHPAPERAFLIAPEEVVKVAKEAVARSLDVVGAWHGHLRGGPFPGDADEEGFVDTPLATVLPTFRALVLVGRGTTGRPVVRAFGRTRRHLREIPLRV